MYVAVMARAILNFTWVEGALARALRAHLASLES